jgi:hypothetical protein
VAAVPDVAPEPPEPGEPGDTRVSPAAGGEASSDPAPPSVHVHADRLGRGVGRLELSPTEALRLAREGRGSLVRRELPPDQEPGGSDADRSG